MFAAGREHLVVELDPLRQHLADYPSPYTLISYLNGAGGRLIHRLLIGELACAHDGFDRLRQTTSVAHLRSLLTVVGILPSRDERLVGVQHRAQSLLDGVNEPADRLLLARYLRWVLLPAANEHTERDGRLGPHSARPLLEQLRTARAFTSYLRATSSTLAGCTQPHVDAWLSSQRWRTSYLRQFLTWAAVQGEATRHVAVSTLATIDDRSIMSDADRLLLAHQLERNETIALPDRVAGCLVLQYGQHRDGRQQPGRNLLRRHPKNS